eukprot:gnl/TRDRNA2_/TRDRNA2_158414_c0_seq1.p1 gnl/TRDRNA2_/TRDRNA2_158414_c0~~gnl/TRDRNA2_/TRDRNA2_158414_c0_seq1.p1  ORF type:complete len:289 (+),score=47.02 gnl/TRDRNA2_/TRDRNA2_158414_c0_seq1:91-867(+)
MAAVAGSPVWDRTAQHELLLAGVDHCDFRKLKLNVSVLAAAQEAGCFEPFELRGPNGSPPRTAAGACRALGLPDDWVDLPWVFEGLTSNKHLTGPHGASGKAAMLRRFGHREVLLNDASAQSQGSKQMRFDTYIQQAMQPSPNVSEAVKSARRGERGSWYLCNSNFWDELLDEYERPPLPGGPEGALSFGVGRSGSGLPFHTHGAAYFEVAQGQKRWFVVPPEGIDEEELREMAKIPTLAWFSGAKLVSWALPWQQQR